jgi:predicted DCC family thiol-disulfide oxidoreductase YuxK
MATLSDKVIIFDDSCPMCRLYTKAFVKLDLLKSENRVGFANLESTILAQIDVDRARHEIPLFDKRTGETVYGLDALCLILASRCPWLSPFLNSRWTRAMLFPVYQIITFNRRVMAGCGPKPGFDCTPDFNLFYRVLYFAVGLLLSGVLFTAVGLASGIGLLANYMFAAVALLLVGIGMARLSDVERWDYLGNLMTITLEFSILISPLCFARSFDEPSLIPAALLCGAFMIFGLELYRRLIQKQPSQI